MEAPARSFKLLVKEKALKASTDGVLTSVALTYTHINKDR